MSLLDMDYLEKIEKFMTSGDMAFEFEHGEEERRYEILDFLEKLMELSDLADEQATKLIFKDGYLEALAQQATKDQK